MRRYIALAILILALAAIPALSGGLRTGGAGGNAATATALAANGANCSANQYPLGVDASGAAESCTADDDVPEAADYTNLTAGNGITISTGVLSLTAVGGSNFGFWGHSGDANSIIAAASQAFLSANNQVRVLGFWLGARTTITKIVFRTGTGVVGKTCGFGIYDSAGTTLLISGTGSCATNNTVTAISPTPASLTMSPGWYYFAYTSDDSTVTVSTSGATGLSAAVEAIINNGTGSAFATCANASSTGALPSSCGAMTDLGGAAAIPLGWFAQ